MNISELKLTYCSKSDVKAIARCHKLAFPDSFSSKLGMRFLVKNYEWYLVSSRTVLVKASIGTEVVGFFGGLLAAENSELGSTSSVMQYTFRQAVVGIVMHPWLIFNNEIWKNIRLILRNVKRKLFLSKRPQVVTTQSKVSKTNVRSSLGLVVIGNDPVYRGKGVGTLLLQRFEVEARERKADQMHLSVKRNNGIAIRAYTNNGWYIKKESGDNYEMVKVLV